MKTTKTITWTALAAAIIAVTAQLQIPMPSGVPITLQTFGIALIGLIFGWKIGLAATFTYIILGAVGAPVFAGFKGGFDSLAGATGGFLIGFLFLATLSGITRKNILISIAFSVLGLILCHLCGILWFSFILGKGFLKSFLTVSAPYFIKDVLSIVLAAIVAYRVNKSLKNNVKKESI